MVIMSEMYESGISVYVNELGFGWSAQERLKSTGIPDGEVLANSGNSFDTLVERVSEIYKSGSATFIDGSVGKMALWNDKGKYCAFAGENARALTETEFTIFKERLQNNR